MTAKSKQVTRRNFGRARSSGPENKMPLPPVPKEPKVKTVPKIEPLQIAKDNEKMQSPIYSSETDRAFGHTTQIRINTHLFDSLNNAIESAIFGGNYSIQSASHFVREALRDHAKGIRLEVPHEAGIKKPLSLRLDADLKAFWDTLPKRHRNNILERAIRTKLRDFHN